MPFHQVRRVGVHDRRTHRLVDDVTPVYKQALITPIRLCKILITDKAAKTYAVLVRTDFVTVLDDSRAVYVGDRGGKSVAERTVTHLSVHIIGKANLGTGKNKTRHHIRDVALFLRVRFQKFQTGGRVVK